MLSDRTSDYLETIYLLSLSHDTVGISQVAAARGVTVPTARAAVGRLKQDGCIRQERYGKILLTDAGRDRAARVYRTHATLYRFLREVLHVPPETADADACRLEHGLSDATLSRLVSFLDSRGGQGDGDASGGAQ
ncbi:MAG: metal-dependent transcriptional regulator [Candidatus Eisenbacteria bacterium]|nr:metal-dependent transcriptional regulator [Candidatus Eisenbacteria bacterium]